MGSVVLHIPHSSRDIPPSARGAIGLSDEELQEELLRMTDAFTDELFRGALPDAVAVRFPVSRLVLDPERFEDDREEPMAKIGMGVIYTATSQLGPLRAEPSAAEREALLRKYYRPHHEELTRVVDRALVESGACLVIDCHSYPSTPSPYEQDQDCNRPDICIGTDDFHTPEELAAALEAAFRERGNSVARNRPFAGALVPMKHYREDPRVRSVMIEINRRLYMDESTGEKSAELATVQRDMAEVLGEIAASTFE